ncbi:MAG: 2-dehydropantoate 2-reductase [Candidatus Tectomicrobia bacterium]|uniref:2-dehydropantoate 2-reductase n=1 Tax=Tectimicrobiota bacterium TaxID=2528274 RepID=A0A932GNY6_UNCTE|nr:2-dehydropantoate 2-reductase [Candidatus Tectomicrobia bacterium]
MNILVMGAGGVGGYYGALLARAGNDVSFVARGDHLRALHEKGLEIRSPRGDFSLLVKAAADPRLLPPPELILFAVKTYDTEEAAQFLQPVAGAGVTVLTLQNGIDSAERIGAILGLEKVLPGAAYIFASITSPGVITHTGKNQGITFGESAGTRSPRTQEVLQVLQGAGIDASFTEDIRRVLWQKFFHICAMGTVACLCRASVGEVLGNPESLALLRDAFEEIHRVAAAEGVPLPEDLTDKAVQFFRASPPQAKPSLLNDLEQGRRLESEALSGTVVRLGERHHIPTPIHRAAYASLLVQERRYRPPTL